MDIQQAKYAAFLKRLPDLVRSCTGFKVHIDPRASVLEPTGKRYVTPYECEVRGLTYACTVAALGKSPFVVMQLPLMLEDGTFIVKGKRRVVMLLQKRAAVPVLHGGSVMLVAGGKLDVAKRTYVPSFGVKAIPISQAAKVGVDPRLLQLVCDKGTAFAFDPGHVDNMRIWTVDRLLEAAVASVLKVGKKAAARARWPEPTVTNALLSAFATGNWRGLSISGVTQLANLANRTSLRAQHSSVISGYTNMQGRYVHPSTYKYFCVSQTPEGQKVGQVHTLVEGVTISDAEEQDLARPPAPGDMPWIHNGKLQDVTSGEQPGTTTRWHDTIWTWSDAGRMSPGSHMLGHTARHIPFLQHNQGPRISYYCSMAKQAMSDTGPHRLLYAQRPLVGPCHEDTAGCNVILAINCMGYNQEDALVASKGALERGLFRSLHVQTLSAAVDDISNVATGQQLAAGTAVMEGASTAPRGAPSSTVMHAAEGEGMSRVTTAALRMPVRGDKLCSRHGQKGVIGMIVPDEDMPFTQDGIRPDLVINAHAFPSRMTVGQIMEMAGAKLGGVDGTAFASTTTMEDLHRRGGSGRELMFDGATGLPLKERIFIAPCWYQRLSHLAQEKCYARGVAGPTDRLTNQPTAGRKNAGGMRLGEMERDVLLGSGATQVLRERMDCIGTTSWSSCATCGKHICQHTFAPRATQEFQVPHATSLLAMELAAMGVEMALS